jgi:hypothetical protein
MSIQSIGAAGASGIDPTWIAHGRDRGDDRDGSRFANAIAAAGKAMGLDADKVAALQQDIAKAVAGVGGGSGAGQAPGDRRTAIADAIDTALKNDGIDPQQFHAQLAQQLHGKHGHHHHRAPDQAAAAPPVDPAAPGSQAGNAPVSPASGALLNRLV